MADNMTKYRIKSIGIFTGIIGYGTGTFDYEHATVIAEGLNKSESGKWLIFQVEPVPEPKLEEEHENGE